MPRYHVTYTYSATGMMQPDNRDYGVIEAASPEAAIEKAILAEMPKDVFYGPKNSDSTHQFMRYCMSAKELP